MTKRQISKETHKLLTDMVNMAKGRNPVQGEFQFLYFNYPETIKSLTEKEGVLNCGSMGCVAGGYLTLLDKRFHFSDTGAFFDGDSLFCHGNLYDELGHDVFYALFFPKRQHVLDGKLRNLEDDASKQEVIANAEYILANNLYYDETL